MPTCVAPWRVQTPTDRNCDRNRCAVTIYIWNKKFGSLEQKEQSKEYLDFQGKNKCIFSF